MANGQKKNGLCFVLSPIGPPRSPARERADKILKHVIKPVCKEAGFEARRADEIREPGLITGGIIKEILQAEMVVADLTGHNPNVFYELGIRHFTGKPAVQLIEETHDIPFDLFDTRTIKIDHKDLDSVDSAKLQLLEFIRNCDHKRVLNNPITRVLQELGIPLPACSKDVHGIPEMFQELSSRILSELKTIRAERTLLLDKTLDTIVGNKLGIDSGMEPSEAGELSGLWNSNNGLVKIVHAGADIFGRYQYGGSWIGSMVGKLLGNRIVFRWRWNNDTLTGLGMLRYVDRSRCLGGWWFESQVPDIEKLIADPTIADALPLTDENRWELWRSSDAKKKS